MDRSGVLVVILLILILAEGSDASLFGKFRSMAQQYSGLEITPSPSPISLQIAPSPQDGSQGGCEVLNSTCKIQKELIACLQLPESGSEESFLLLQNEGESPVNVTVTVPATVNIASKDFEILEHEVKKINFSISTRGNAEIVLNAEIGKCTLHIYESRTSQWILTQVSRVTPIYGAYIVLLTTFIVGGTWASCKLRRKLRRKGRPGDGGIPYQELEMALPESVSAVNVDTADGWDRGWDDDWDEEKAVRPSAGNVTSNGHTSRSSNRNGWENDWDD